MNCLTSWTLTESLASPFPPTWGSFEPDPLHSTAAWWLWPDDEERLEEKGETNEQDVFLTETDLKLVLLLAQRLTAARHGYSFSRVFRSLITSTCRRKHAEEPVSTHYLTLTGWEVSSPSPRCSWTALGRSRPREEPPCVQGLSRRCRGKPAWGDESRQVREKTKTWVDLKKQGDVFDPPPTLQSFSQLHQPLPLRLLRRPQTQNTRFVLRRFYVGLSHLKWL